MNNALTLLLLSVSVFSYSQNKQALNFSEGLLVTAQLSDGMLIHTSSPDLINGYATIYSNDYRILPLFIEIPRVFEQSNRTFQNFVEKNSQYYDATVINSDYFEFHSSIDEVAIFRARNHQDFKYIIFIHKKGGFGAGIIKIETKWFNTDLDVEQIRELNSILKTIEIIHDKP